MMQMLATHKSIEDFASHISADHVWSSIYSYTDQLKMAEFHYWLHASGLGHKAAE